MLCVAKYGLRDAREGLSVIRTSVRSFRAESSVVVFLSLLCFRLVILLFYVFIVYLYPCAALCAYSINK